jgi:cytochrome c-type biogenesis protein CcmH/NrfG
MAYIEHHNLKLDQIYIRLGSIYLHESLNRNPVDQNSAQIAKSMFLKSCHIYPTSRSWLGVGRACVLLEEFVDAEDAFAEANILNNRDSEIWAYLAQLSLSMGRNTEANRAVSQAIRLGIKDDDLLKYDYY